MVDDGQAGGHSRACFDMKPVAWHLHQSCYQTWIEIELMNKLLMTPWWILQIFTQTKSFKKNPILGSPWLNRMGLHLLRVLIAFGIMRFRMFLLSGGIKAEHKKSFYQNGFILIHDLLPEDQFKHLKEEVYTAKGEVRECTQGDTLTHRILLDEAALSGLPQCAAALDHAYLVKLLKFASGKNYRPISHIQTIKNHFVDGNPDPQKNLHTDTFHPTMKSWFFLDDVDESNGPFTYVPGSNRLTLARLKWEYRKSTEVANGTDLYSANGSFRVSKDDLHEMGLPAPASLKVPANTLVVANTHGFHCRGKANKRSTRTELWTISRNSPFNPLPGIDLPLLNRLQNQALNYWRRHCDRKAQARGGQSSWHVIDARNTVRPE